MEKEQLLWRTAALGVYRALLRDEGVRALTALLRATEAGARADAWGAYYAALCARGCTENSGAYFAQLLADDENAFSRASAAGERPSKGLTAAVSAELETLAALAALQPSDFYDGLPQAVYTALPHWGTGAFSPTAAALRRQYRAKGYGVFARSIAYTWNVAEKRFEAVENVSGVRLRDLKGYEDEKQAVADNTQSFLQGLPANNVLLYGDRGTGKSSTVHAVLNEYAPQGLRLVEVTKAAIADFPYIVGQLQRLSLRFVLFLDDLSFTEGEDNYAGLKAALEGSVGKNGNVLIYATTNRRHLLKESAADRQGDDMRVRDTREEQLSLSDRFGLVVTYQSPDKREFLSILRQILDDRGLQVDEARLSLLAEQYALGKGGRSPRAAKQFADMLESKIRRKLF